MLEGETNAPAEATPVSATTDAPVPAAGSEEAFSAFDSGLADLEKKYSPAAQDAEQKDIPAEEKPAEDGGSDDTVIATPLQDRAKLLGLDDEDVSLMGENADKILSKLEDKVFAAAMEKAKDVKDTAEPVPAKEAEPAKPEQSDVGNDTDIEKMLEDGGFGKDDPEYKLFLSMSQSNKTLLGAVEALGKKIGDVVSAQKAGAESSQMDSVTGKFFAGVAKQYGEIAPDKQQEIADKARVLVAGMRSEGKEMSLDAALEWASRATIAEMDSANRTRAVMDTAEKRRSAFISKPGVTTNPKKPTAMTDDERLAELGSGMQALQSKHGG